jgi:hypothetical protein
MKKYNTGYIANPKKTIEMNMADNVLNSVHLSIQRHTKRTQENCINT